MSDAVASIENVAGVISVRVDRRLTAFVVRYDPSVTSTSDLVGCVEASRLELR
jgi:copper chaperone CopZ